MNAKITKWIEETATDPVRLRAAIFRYTKLRTKLFYCALFFTGLAVAEVFTAHNPVLPLLLTASTAMMWINFVQVDSHRQLFILIDKFFKDEKAAA